MAYIIRIRSCQFDLRSITVEPVVFLYMFTSFLTLVTFQALTYEKVCKQHYNTTVCANLENKTFEVEEEFVQKTTSSWILYTNLALGLPSLVIVVLFLGPWGDRVDRKIPVICPLIGGILATVSNIVNSVYIDAPLPYILIGPFLNGLAGSFIAVLMAVYSYIAHVSTPAYRTIKIGILEAMIFLSGTVGTALSGVILDQTSYVFVFSLIAGIMILALLYTIVWVDSIKPESTPDTNKEVKNCCQSFLLASVKDVFLCVYDKRRSKNFIQLALLNVVIFVLMLVSVGEADILLIYTRRRPFEWSQTTYALYRGLESFLRGIAVLTLLPILKRQFKTRDTTFMILGLVSKTAALVVLGVGNSTAVLFIGAVSGLLIGFGSAGMRSMSSGMVSRSEQGKLYSLIGMVESISTLAATSLFNTVYSATLDFYAGFCFLIAAVLVGCCLIIAGYLHIKLSKDTARDYDTLQNEIAANEVVIDQHNIQTDTEVES
ncbi:proton-coupled folate transporter-like [Mercenaria mercenaria]|uniref:proton-coupled folate transporter-like n=1 Tax=Mercenaria mercenaria TaxID=6596 RepID=UPI00234F3756|nr:proton-coupled folate transporter-like [Mercenaria mercenaria]XP_045187203.2 proton-coupled folate transporter-like [Mercenaria mercenaria]XP_045187204.2 proton-coupled folate transporter-like [Mercenaria mercenaria]XP_045187205.2 proton-coupled folate transporter-like [Mercenaria mercenaria]XP_045187206.2 proton-coupled folate transporter-like [Mercenaria mercenaria]XP_053395245.1 proton-coupled folate transporter-like [Mercenaria mercenaria]